jgi:pantoate--beta-alanine ligase
VERITDPEQLRDLCRSWRCGNIRTALVPTMGFFHQGHLDLMAWAREHADKVVVSLFVNPTQFGPNEDLESYPRDLERDARLAEEQGVDVLFMPDASAIYAPDHDTWVTVPGVAEHLCGARRPGHFQGVATVVAKLLILAMPNVAVFGQKDWQQLAVIRRMVQDLGLPVEIEGRSTVREPDGLAMSSRNLYLGDEERAQAPHLRQGLLLAGDMVRAGQGDVATLADAVRKYYDANLSLGRVDYLEFTDPDTIQPVDVVRGPTLLAVAMFLGRARLIDNVLIGPDFPRDPEGTERHE